MNHNIHFSILEPKGNRIHHVCEEDIRAVLSRLPLDVQKRLRGVHFNDRSRGARTLGYVNRGRREIALCALPARMSLTRFLVSGQTPKQFGATRGEQWPSLAIRRFLLYDVFLHELGHLQIVDKSAISARRKFAMETKAQEFAMQWCRQLWAEPFNHPDPVHNEPTAEELADEEPETTFLLGQIQFHPDDAQLFERLAKVYHARRMAEEERAAYEKSLLIDPNNPWTNLFLGNWYCAIKDFVTAIRYFARAAVLMPGLSVAWWCLAEAYEQSGQMEQANAHYQTAVKVEPSDREARKKLKAWQKRFAGRAVG